MKPVNLNQFRKQKTRAEKKARADENAVKFGRTKDQRQADAAETDRLKRHLDDHKGEN